MKSTIKILAVAFTASLLVFTACNSDTTETKTESATPAAAKADSLMLGEGEKFVYKCPMPEDSAVVSDKPGKCPKCGMDLERKVVKDSVTAK